MRTPQPLSFQVVEEIHQIATEVQHLLRCHEGEDGGGSVRAFVQFPAFAGEIDGADWRGAGSAVGGGDWTGARQGSKPTDEEKG